jgi:fused signal recognition particle receptor
MALRDLWGKLTGKPAEPEATPLPYDIPLSAWPEISPDDPLDELAQPPGDIPATPPEMPPLALPELPPQSPREIPVGRPLEAPVPAPEPIQPLTPPEQPAPAAPPSSVPPGWQPSPAEWPTPPRDPAPAAPPPEIPLQPTAPGPQVPPEVPAPVPGPGPELPAVPFPLAPVPPQPPAPAPAQPEPPPPEPPATRAFAPGVPVAPAPMPRPALLEPILATPEPATAEADDNRAGWFGRLKAGLSRSTARLTENLTSLFVKRRLDDEALEELEETLISADLGVAAATRIVANFRKSRFGKEVTDEEVREALAEEISAILAPVARPLVLDNSLHPHVVLVVGVNGTGKTTTIAKLGQQWREAGKTVTFVAGDTFRAAAVEQLQIWGERTGCDVVAPAKQGADAAGLAFDALTQARAKQTDVLLVDTAGRLHNKSALMEELRKVVRVMQRVDPTAPHSVLLVLDATTGQNATQQCKVFSELVNVTGLVVTKLDGSAKGGIVVALAQEFGLPVHAVGVGEKAADLRPFSARDFSRSLLGLN